MLAMERAPFPTAPVLPDVWHMQNVPRPRAGSGDQAQPQTGTAVETETIATLARPWKVIVHDDPITLMNYVVMVFRTVFGYPQEKAFELMMQVHQQGKSIVWTGAREPAEMYVQKLHSHQLQATLEITEA